MRIEKIFISLLIFSVGQISAQKIGGWYTTDSLHEKKQNHAGIILNNGNILITGGNTPNQYYPSNETEIFDVKDKKWNISARMNKGRSNHNLVKLNDGSILAIGGFCENTCEILNSDYTQWLFTDSLKKKRFYNQTATVLHDGNVLLIGGYTDYPVNDTTEALKECEIYDYLKSEWKTISSLHTGRYLHTATVLQDGRVLVTGGMTIQNGTKLLDKCEIFDPISKEWTHSAPMHYPRAGHSATLLSNGKVLVIGGQQNYSELYNPQTNQWEVEGQVYLASGHNTAIVLKNEEYLLLVHDVDGYITRPGWELYSLKNFKSIYNEKFTRYIKGQVIVKINDHSVIVIGGPEAILVGGGLIIRTTSFCQIYDINLTGIREDNEYNNLPSVFSLSCYPNPFNSSTNITVELSSSEHILLKVYNTLGEEVDVIYKGELNIGTHTFRYRMNNHSSGVYFVRMHSSKEAKLIKIIYQK
jgi:N-acetylneuraminic acid mutarotase